MNYLDQEQKQKMEKIFNLQNSIEASKEKQEERITSYDNYLNNNMKNKTEELKMKKLLIQKKQRDKKKKLEKKMNDWIHQQEKITEEQNKEYEKNKLNKESEDNTLEENELDDDINNTNNDYNEKFDISKYNVVSMDNMKQDNNEEENRNKDIEENNKEAICLICQRKFASVEKLKLHEKLSELHQQNLAKLKLNNQIRFIKY